MCHLLVPASTEKVYFTVFVFVLFFVLAARGLILV